MPKSKCRRRSNRNKTGYIGVTKASSGRYEVTITVDGKSNYLGSYDTAKQAAKAYDKEAIKSRRPFSSLNYPKKAPVGYTPIKEALYFSNSSNTVGYRGISKHGMEFRADIMIGGKLIHIGMYNTTKEAAIAYDRELLKSNKPRSLLNFPDGFSNKEESESDEESSSSSSLPTTKPLAPAPAPPPPEVEIIGIRVGPKPDDESEWL
jgi:hypothetical protein